MQNERMPHVITLLRVAATGLALALAFLPALAHGGGDGLTLVDERSFDGAEHSPGGASLVVQADEPAGDNPPGWVWAVVGGSAGAVIAFALGYHLWLSRRR